ncbi:MAG: hypothetical protein HC919_15615 [Oscillatoriales cyanobacterium SM2_2_1]|nr:hypothetical protein [Oscillatoriales cyanobacterium SM2_2_1]NJL83297.1 hypothetical protein [Chloroflexaceae bacterium]
MEPGSPSGNLSEPPRHRWAAITGTAIALLTLTLPLLFIANYSTDSSVRALPRTTYSLPRQNL